MKNSPIVIKAHEITKEFRARQSSSIKETVIDYLNKDHESHKFIAINNLSLEVHAGTTVGLIGHNGSGKSTLLKILGGILHPDYGTVKSRGRIAALIELGAGFHPDLTGRENIYLNAALMGLTKEQTSKKLDEIIDFSGVEDFIDTPVKFYSSGMYVRLAFSVAINVDPDILLVDEVLAVGDEPFQHKCLSTIRNFQSEGRTIIFVSHSASQVTDLCTEVLLLDHGNVKFHGDPEQAVVLMRKGYSALQEHSERIKSKSNLPRILEVIAQYSPSIVNNLSIKVDLLSPNYDQNLVIGIAVETASGMRVYEINTASLGVNIPPFSGNQSFTFELPDFNLGKGNYSVTVGLGNSQGITFDRIESADTFEVSQKGNGSGILAVQTNVVF